MARPPGRQARSAPPKEVGGTQGSQVSDVAPLTASSGIGGEVGAGGVAGALHTPSYVHSTAEYVAVRRSDLREMAEFGWLEEGAGAIGVFFFSGAFWLAVTLLVEHWEDLGKYWSGFLLCLLSVFFGLSLIWIAHRHFKLREQRINDYFNQSTNTQK
jgi:hypothetical protein